MSKAAGRPKSSKWFFPGAACMPAAPALSGVEAFPAAAGILDVGVVELEAFVQALARVIEFGAVEIDQALGVHNHLGAVALVNMIVRLDLVGVFDDIGLAGTTGGTHTEAQPLALAAFFDEFPHALGGGGCHGNCHIVHLVMQRRPSRPCQS